MNCSKCSKDFTGQGVTESQLAKALGLTLCSECWFVLEYGNDQTPIARVALLGTDGYVLAEQLPAGQGGVTLAEVKADTDIASALSLKHSSQAFPVGSVFISVVNTNPGTLLGYGTWSAFATGRMLVGIDSGDTDFDTVEETGGAKTKTIAQANLPNISTGAGTSHNHTQDSHTHVITELRDATTGSVTTNIALSADTSSTIGTKVTGGKVAVNQPEAAHTHSLGGSGTALDVVNPYIVVYMWKRTA